MDFADTVIRTQRCVLRPWQKQDAPLLPPIADTKDISWNTSYKFPNPFDLAAAKKYLQFCMNGLGQTNWQFAIRRNDTLMGGCGCIRGEDVHAHTATMGYWLGVNFWGKGYATECVAALVEFMRTETDVVQLTATTFGWNPASGKVLEKCGFAMEGIRKGVVRKWDLTTDLWIYGKQL